MRYKRPLRIPVASLVRAQRFYAKVFDVTCRRDPARAGAIQFETEGRKVILELITNEHNPVDTKLTIRVSDFAYEYQRLAAAGVRFRSPPRTGRSGGWLARICDPDGNWITVVESRDSEQAEHPNR